VADFIDDPAQRLNDLLDQQEIRIATIFRTAIADMRDQLDLNALADLIEAGRVNEALDQLKFVADQLGAATNVSFVTTGQNTADFITSAGVGRIVFDQVNMGAVAIMQASSLNLIREFSAEQRRATNLALVAGIEAGTNPRAQARSFRDSIGLTTKQWQYVVNYKRSLQSIGTDEQAAADALSRELRDRRGDAQVRAAIRDTRPLPPEKIDWLVERYRQRWIKYRSEVIGRTEALRAVNAGNEEMYRQAIEAGTVRPEQLVRTWQTRLDGRERDTHELLHNQTRRWGEVWTTRHGALRFPGDPEAPASEVIQCRCALATRIRKAR
jgi:hypothetical protein